MEIDWHHHPESDFAEPNGTDVLALDFVDASTENTGTYNSTTSINRTAAPCTKYHRCNRSGCLTCDTRKGLSKVPEIVHNLTAKAKAGTLYYLTLTLHPNGLLEPVPDERLTHQLDRLDSALENLRRDPFWTARVRGGIYRLHVNHPGYWHAHYHLILESEPLNKSDLQLAWDRATRCRDFSVDLQHVGSTDLDLLRLSRYVMKAPQRSLKNAPQHLLEEYKAAAKGRRKVQKFGTWINTRWHRGRWERLAPERSREVMAPPTSWSPEDEQRLLEAARAEAEAISSTPATSPEDWSTGGRSSWPTNQKGHGRTSLSEGKSNSSHGSPMWMRTASPSPRRTTTGSMGLMSGSRGSGSHCEPEDMETGTISSPSGSNEVRMIDGTNLTRLKPPNWTTCSTATRPQVPPDATRQKMMN